MYKMVVVTTILEELWTAKKVAERFEEAVSTLNKLPPVKMHGYKSSWPEIRYTPNELMCQESKCFRIPPTPAEISRLDQIQEWIPCITVEERKIIWRRAEGARWKTIAYEFKCDRTTAWYKWTIGLNKISAYLNAQKKC